MTLALGIGVNTAVFSMINFMLLRPLPVPEPDRITALGQQVQGSTFYPSFSYPDLLDYRNQDTSSEIAGYELTLAGLSVAGKAERGIVTYVTGNYFSMLGVQPAVGRLILPSEGSSPGADPNIVLGYSYWKRRLGADPHVVGQRILVNGQPVTVVGVTPQNFHGVYALVDTDAYLPLSLAVVHQHSERLWTDRNERSLSAIARLKPGVTIAQAEASLNIVAARLSQLYPATNKNVTVRVFPEKLARPEPELSSSLPVIATLFLILAGVLLLVACVNVTNLLLARASVRQQEMAVRTALGATRTQLGRQLLTESILLALLGGAAGILVGKFACILLSSIRLHLDIPIRLDFSFDLRVFGYAFMATFLTSLMVGIMPALRASRVHPNATLQEAGRGFSSGRNRQRFRNALVVTQVAGSLALLIVGGLFVRSLLKAQHMYLGFDPDHVLNLTMDVREAGYDETRGRAFYRELTNRVGALPGVQSASFAFSVPFGYYRENSKVYVSERPPAQGEQLPEIFYNNIDPNYFQTLRIPLYAGRAFTDADNETAPRVAIINQTMAKQFWPNQDAIGKEFRFESSSGPPIRVVGVSRDGTYIKPAADPQPYFFIPLAQHYMPVRTLHIRTINQPEAAVGELLEQIRKLEPNLPVFDVQTMPRALEGINGFFLFQFGAGFAGILGALGLVLALIGVFGVISYAASQRSHEMGIRVALGAQRHDIRKLILGQGLRLVVLGVILGTFTAFAISRLMSNLLVGISIVDPLTFGSICILTTMAALIACYIPARRAMRVDPISVLRYQ